MLTLFRGKVCFLFWRRSDKVPLILFLLRNGSGTERMEELRTMENARK
jgi:hypothetical protein